MKYSIDALKMIGLNFKQDLDKNGKDNWKQVYFYSKEESIECLSIDKTDCEAGRKFIDNLQEFFGENFDEFINYSSQQKEGMEFIDYIFPSKELGVFHFVQFIQVLSSFIEKINR